MSFRLLAYVLIYSRAVWGYISSRMPRSNVLSKLSTGFLTAWNTALSYRPSLALLEDNVVNPSRSFRRGIFSSQLMIRRHDGQRLSQEDSWGFHADIEEDESPQNYIPLATKNVKDSLVNIAEKIYSKVSFMQEKSVRRSISIEVVETTEYNEKVNLGRLWQWENEEAESAFFLTTKERKTPPTMGALSEGVTVPSVFDTVLEPDSYNVHMDIG